MDWIKFDWGDNLDNSIFRFYPNKKITADYSNAKELAHEPPLKESINLVEQIVNSYPPPFNLFLSGGVDSQSMLYSWLESGHEFTAYSFVYNNGINKHDIGNLWHVSKRFNVKINFIDIDYFKFLKYDLEDYVLKYLCNSPQITFYMKFPEVVNKGTKIFSGDFNLYNLNFTSLGLYRYSLINDKNIIPFFFFHTAKMANSWKEHSKIDDFILYQKSVGIKEFKDYIYLRNGFDILPIKKYSGFERSKDVYDKIKITREERNKYLYLSSTSTRAYDFKFRYKFFDINNYVEKFEWINFI